MKRMYYNNEQTSRILSNYEEDPYGTITRLEQYLEEYPTDYTIYPYYCNELIKVGLIKKAEVILNKVTKEYSKHREYVAASRREVLDASLIITRLKVLSYTKNYTDCLGLAKKNFELVYNNGMNLNKLILFCKKKLGDLELERRFDDTFPYSYNQIISYDDSYFLEHIKRFSYLNITEDNYLENPFFSKEFPTLRVVNEIKNVIPNDNRLNNSIIENCYYFKYDGCGTVNGKSVDYFLVIALDDSNNLITMYPTEIGSKVPYYDLNYLLLEESKPKTLKKSRIDKFNEKYGFNVDKK